jgi:serine phosphatase RsbU (regulator of sigma subunit)/tetratricopeptide (TPR) repeat protein
VKKIVIYFIFYTSVLVPLLSLAQQVKPSDPRNRTFDSLQKSLKISKEDTTQVIILNELSWEYINTGNYKQALQCAIQAQHGAEKINFKRGNASSFNKIANIYFYQGDYSKALDNYFISLKIRNEIGDKIGISDSYGNIGGVYMYQGNYEKALDNYLKCLKICEETGNKQGIGNAYNNIGIIYFYQRDFKKALSNHLKSSKIRVEMGDKRGIAASYSNIGSIYEIQTNYQQSLENYLRALKIQEELGDKQAIAGSYGNIGVVYQKQLKYEKALNSQFKCLQISKEIGYIEGIGNSYNNIGSIYMKQGKIEKSYHYLNQALKINKEIGYKNGIKETYSSLFELSDKNGDYKQAYNYHKLYSDIKDTLLNEQSSKQIAEMNTKYDSEKKDKELIKKDAEINKQQAETEKQNLQRNAFIIGFALVLVLAFFIFRGYRQKRSANKLLEEKNLFIENQKLLVENKNEIIEEKQKEIIASITYAKRIQQAILPPDKLVKEFLPNSFILYKPKDIVAGDFYWIEKIDDVILIAAADCTGHGVPGAMVSVVCNNALNRSLREFGLKDPGKLLDKTRELVIEQFEKSEEEVKDGMDISLCALSDKTNQLLWAGANNPLWIIRDGELTDIKSNKQPIGKYIEPKPFSTHTLQLEKGDTIYIFSDGYADQFGGERGKKFKASAMKELLLKIQHNTMEEQKQLLEQTFETWKGSLEQVDDVLIIGIRT